MPGTGGDIIGLIPAAGLASRLGPLPCSKELFPVGFEEAEGGTPRPTPAIQHLLDKMARGGVRRAIIVLREGKWDLPAYLGRARDAEPALAYVLMRRPFGVPFSVDDARPFVAESTVLFGFPDILSRPDDLFERLVNSLKGSEADAAVALYPRTSAAADGISLGPSGEIRSWDPEPDRNYGHTWIAAAWGPEFTRYLASFVTREESKVRADVGGWRGREIVMGDVLWSAIEAGLHVKPVMFDDGSYMDIGTPEDLMAAVREYAGEE